MLGVRGLATVVTVITGPVPDTPDTDMWGVTTAASLYMVSSAAGSAAHPVRSRQQGTRWKSGTVPQR